MSNRGRHKKKIKAINIDTVNLIYSEIVNFRFYHHLEYVMLDLKNTIITVKPDITISELINILKFHKNNGSIYVRVPNSNLIEDKYYKI